jgi:hypothetical protein
MVFTVTNNSSPATQTNVVETHVLPLIILLHIFRASPTEYVGGTRLISRVAQPVADIPNK